MKNSLQDKLNSGLRAIYTEGEIESLLAGSADSRYGKVKRLLAQGKLLRIRRGLYCLAGNVNKPHPYTLAQQIYGPSYISLESALSFHKLIPEAVYATTSVCIKRTKEFNTPLGVFSYQHLPAENFYTEVELVNQGGEQFFMAKPWKAICDYVYCYKKNWRNLSPLLNSLRIEREDLPELSVDESILLSEYYQQQRIYLFLKGIQQDFINYA